jgi:hypothetical protein
VRGAWWTLFLASLPVAAAAWLLAGLLVLNAVSPARWPFIASFEVRNATAEDLRLTPVGLWSPRDKAVLRQYALAVPAIPAFRSVDIPVAAGETVTIRFDVDDIQLSELVWRRADGSLRVQVVDPEAGASCCDLPRQGLFVLGSVEGLPRPDPRAEQAMAEYPSMWLFLAPLPLVLLPRWLWRLGPGAARA